MRSSLKLSVVLLGGLLVLTGCASRGWVKQIEGQVKQDSKRLDTVGQRVDGLNQRVEDIDVRVGRLAGHHHAPNVLETIDVRFGFNRTDLDDNTMTRLHELAKQMKDDTRLNVELIGFTDTKGAKDYNAQLAQKRVDAVKRYLAQRGVMPSRMAAVGYGPLNDRNVAEPQKRRVTIHVTVHEAMVMANPQNFGSGSPETTPKVESQ